MLYINILLGLLERNFLIKIQKIAKFVSLTVYCKVKNYFACITKMFSIYAGTKRKLVYKDFHDSPDTKRLCERFGLIKSFCENFDRSKNLDIWIEKNFNAVVFAIYGCDSIDDVVPLVPIVKIFGVLDFLDVRPIEYEFWSGGLTTVSLDNINLYPLSKIKNLDLSNCERVQTDMLAFFSCLLSLKIGSVESDESIPRSICILPSNLINLVVRKKTDFSKICFPESLTKLEVNFDFDQGQFLPKTLIFFVSTSKKPFRTSFETEGQTLTLDRICPKLVSLTVHILNLSVYGCATLPASLQYLDARGKIFTHNEVNLLPYDLKTLIVAGIMSESTMKFPKALTKIVINRKYIDFDSFLEKYPDSSLEQVRKMIFITEDHLRAKFATVKCVRCEKYLWSETEQWFYYKVLIRNSRCHCTPISVEVDKPKIS
jgi:hypothetical protein